MGKKLITKGEAGKRVFTRTSILQVFNGIKAEFSFQFTPVAALNPSCTSPKCDLENKEE